MMDDTTTSEVRLPTLKVTTLSELRERSDLQGPMPWSLEPFTARGHLSLFFGPPKEGKSTFLGSYAHAAATGAQFLQQPVEKNPVLIVPPEEPERSLLKRFNDLGTPGEGLIVSQDRDPSLEKIANTANAVGAGLVILDTLSSVSGVEEENDNGAWNRWFRRLIPLVRESNAAWVLVHHTRKGGEVTRDSIRGASTILSQVDVAFGLSRSGNEKSQRCLEIVASRIGDELEWTVSFDGSRYYLVGDRATTDATSDEASQKIIEYLQSVSGSSQKITEIEKGAGVPRATVYRHCRDLHSHGIIEQDGTGERGDPESYFIPSPNEPEGARPDALKEHETAAVRGAVEGEASHRDEDPGLVSSPDDSPQGEAPQDSDALPPETEDPTEPLRKASVASAPRGERSRGNEGPRPGGQPSAARQEPPVQPVGSRGEQSPGVHVRTPSKKGYEQLNNNEKDQSSQEDTLFTDPPDREPPREHVHDPGPKGVNKRTTGRKERARPF